MLRFLRSCVCSGQGKIPLEDVAHPCFFVWSRCCYDHVVGGVVVVAAGPQRSQVGDVRVVSPSAARASCFSPNLQTHAQEGPHVPRLVMCVSIGQTLRHRRCWRRRSCLGCCSYGPFGGVDVLGAHVQCGGGGESTKFSKLSTSGSLGQGVPKRTWSGRTQSGCASIGVAPRKTYVEKGSFLISIDSSSYR